MKLKFNMYITFYKENLEFPISGVDGCSINYKSSMIRVYKALKPLIGKKTNVRIDRGAIKRVFLSNFVYFCKVEGIDYRNILELEVIQDGEDFKIIVREGVPKNVYTLTI